MIKKINFLMALLIISIFLIGCTNEEKAELNSTEESEIQTSTKEENTVQSIEDNKKELLNKFKNKFPNAITYNDAMYDINKDNSKELLVIFDTPEKKVNIAFLTDNDVKGFSIGEGNGYSFDYIKDSLKFDESTNYFFITVHDELHKITVDYKITVETAEENKETNFIVESMNERKD
ncbi:hypothetical protein FC756_03635 [Lysinibacillus mangiferihumi]|uniref:Lipoprotein n=1 Tax=Lysinibacillus mangiferihumi TaxID=1130819 RepID=A0A4U2ZBU6_9BACI|nr:hypothetical protein [Lysinibacillus mangiferihumi]TKI71897.1 hypothetical protein FC756_03635 [Lysinibacillus mangiferihumi]